MFYDELVNTWLISGIASLTNFGWTETTGFKVARGLREVGSKVEPGYFGRIRDFRQIFGALGRNLFLILISLAATFAPALVLQAQELGR